MITITKNHIQNLLVMEHLASLRRIEETITLYEHRYGEAFATFEERVTTSVEENMTAWDDYCEWLAFEQSRTETLATLAELRNGKTKKAVTHNVSTL
jgi:hypothetical protein